MSNLGFLAPEKDSPDDLEEIPQKIVQIDALAATFWAKTKFSMFGKFSKKSRFFAKSKGNMLQR